MFAKNGPPKTDFERVLQERREIPVYAAVHKYQEFQQTLSNLLEHPGVRNRTAHLASLFTPDPSIVANPAGANSAELPKSSREREAPLRAFHETFCAGMRKASSPIEPAKLSYRDVAIDSSKVVTFTDLKMAMLRTVVRDSLEQILQRPGDPRADQALVDRIISLTSADGLSFSEKESIRAPATHTVVGAFADLVSSPTFNPPATLSPIQTKLLEALFCSHTSLGHESEALIGVAMADAILAAGAARLIFIRGNYDGKLPQELLGVKLQYPEKVVLSVIESISLIERALLPKATDAERVDFPVLAFGDHRATWAVPHIPRELITTIQRFFEREDLERVVHRTHNIKTNRLGFLLPEAFTRAGLPPALWPHRADRDENGSPSST
jgi:hypothetical protein